MRVIPEVRLNDFMPCFGEWLVDVCTCDVCVCVCVHAMRYVCVVRLEQATLFGSRATLETNLVYSGRIITFKTYLIWLLRENGLLAVRFFSKRTILRGIFMFYQPKKLFMGHIKVPGGLHVARGPNVAQALSLL